MLLAASDDEFLTCRSRFITWVGGNVPNTIWNPYTKAEEDMMDALSKPQYPGSKKYGTGAIKRAWHDTYRTTSKMQPQPESVSEYVAKMEPNVPSLLTDADEGTNLWRHRVRGLRKRFMRKQLLVTVSILVY